MISSLCCCCPNDVYLENSFKKSIFCGSKVHTFSDYRFATYPLVVGHCFAVGSYVEYPSVSAWIEGTTSSLLLSNPSSSSPVDSYPYKTYTSEITPLTPITQFNYRHSGYIYTGTFKPSTSFSNTLLVTDNVVFEGTYKVTITVSFYEIDTYKRYINA